MEAIEIRKILPRDYPRQHHYMIVFDMGGISYKDYGGEYYSKPEADAVIARLEAEVERLKKIINDEITFLHDEGEHGWARCLEEDLGEN